jgi:WD40 repeat protein/serine/threonine protein kinase
MAPGQSGTVPGGFPGASGPWISHDGLSRTPTAEAAVTDESVFAAALAIADPARRAAYLDGACAGRPGLRREVEELLAAHAADNPLDRPPADLARTGVYQPPAERPGVSVGPYKLLQEIGEGGMGTVFMAEQTEPVRRKVALKIIKPGMDSCQVVARFEAERQALSLMDHPNIAKVLDAGTTASGRPYFVMELVHGVPITEFCDANKLTPRQRLELFVPLCHAIQHAHQKGIIHRDIKPSNVLVTLYDDRPVPKVIDFGVAKATEQRLTDKTLFTQFGALVGTFEYMSPEQAEMNALGVDTRSDVYSLGVLLYELLTGTTPLERQRLRGAALGEVVRLIKEEEPPRPSRRLSTSGTLAKVAAARRTEPAKLSALVRGELDWIAMRCLEKDRTRRYDSASSLARDVEHYLHDEPVEACPPTVGYRVRKFARRYRTPLRVAGAFLLLLVLGVVASVWQAVRATVLERQARDQERAADRAREEAEQRRDELAALNGSLRRAAYVADMNLAQHAWEANNLVRTRELLDRHRPGPGQADLRGFEWYYLQRLFLGGRWAVQAHAGPVFALAYAPDGRRIFSCGAAWPAQPHSHSADWPGEVKLWEAATGRQLPLALQGPTDRVCRIALSPDGKRLAAGCGRQGIRVWDLATGQPMALEVPAREIVFYVGFSPDGKRLVSSSLGDDASPFFGESPGVLRVWDLESRKTRLTLDNVQIAYHGPAFSPDGKYLAVASSHRRAVRVLEAATGREVFSCDFGGAFVFDVVFSPDGKSLAACGEHDPIIWDVATRQKRVNCPSASHQGTSLAYSPDGTRLAMASMEGLLELWGARTGQRLDTLKGHRGYVRSVAFSPDASSLASAGGDGTVRVWDTAGRADSGPVLKEGSRLGYVDLSPDGQTVLAEFLDEKCLRLTDAATGRPRGGPIPFAQWLHGFDWTADGNRLIVPGEGDTVAIHDAATGARVRTFRVDREATCFAALSPDGRWCAHSGPGGTVAVLDTDTGARRHALKGLADRVFALAVSPDGSRVAGVDRNGWVKAWDVATGRETMSARVPDVTVKRIRFSPDARRLAVVGDHPSFQNGEVRILDADTGREVVHLQGHTLVVNDLAFSPDGQRLATGSDDRTVRVWDLASGQEVLQLQGHTRAVASVRFVSGGRRLVSASSDRTVHVWDATLVPEGKAP